MDKLTIVTKDLVKTAEALFHYFIDFHTNARSLYYSVVIPCGCGARIVSNGYRRAEYMKGEN